MVIKYLLDIGLELTLKQLLLLTGIYILLSLLGMICSYLSQYYSWKCKTSLKAKLKMHLMNKLLNFMNKSFIVNKEMNMFQYFQMILKPLLNNIFISLLI